MSQSRILYTSRQPKPKPKKFSKERIRIILALVGFFALLGACIGVVRLSYFQIREIGIGEVPGDAGMMGTEQDTQDIRVAINNSLSGNYALVIPRRFIFGIRSSSIEERLQAALPRFATIAVAKQFPHVLAVSFTKRVFFALLCNDTTKTDIHSCGYIDRMGFVYEDAPEASGSLIVKIKSDIPDVKVGMRAIDESTVRQMSLLGDGVGRIAGLRLISYELSGQAPDELRMHVAPSTGGGFTLIVKKNDNLEAVLRILRTVLDEEIKDNRSKLDYVDLRLGNKVFFKLR